MDYTPYISMQKRWYERPERSAVQLVGNYDWHESLPYETQLLYFGGDIRFPIFESTRDKIALDFGCGPGRMIRRMNQLFMRCDGCDISEKMITEGRQTALKAISISPMATTLAVLSPSTMTLPSAPLRCSTSPSIR